MFIALHETLASSTLPLVQASSRPSLPPVTLSKAAQLCWYSFAYCFLDRSDIYYARLWVLSLPWALLLGRLLVLRDLFHVRMI